MVVEVIKWDEPSAQGDDIVIYRHDAEDFSCTAQLLVGPSQVALFENEGEIIPFLPGHYTLDESNNSNFGFIRKWRAKHSEGVSSFHCKVYFVNMIHFNNLRFGTSDSIQMQDPEEGVNIHVRAAGFYGVHVDNDDKDGKNVIRFFLDVVGNRIKVFTKEDLENYLRPKIVERVKTNLGQLMVNKKVGILNISPYIQELSDSMKEQMKSYFAGFGFVIDNFSFLTINAPDEDLKLINDAKIAAKQMEVESIAMAEKRKREGYTYQQERGLDVLEAAANNEASPGQLMGAGMGLGMGIGVGGAFGGQMGNIAQNAFGSMYGNVPPQGYGYPPQGVPPQGYGYPPQGVPPQGYGYPPQGMQPQQNASAPFKKCPTCGTELPVEAMFCFKCGTKMEQ